MDTTALPAPHLGTINAEVLADRFHCPGSQKEGCSPFSTLTGLFVVEDARAQLTPVLVCERTHTHTYTHTHTWQGGAQNLVSVPPVQPQGFHVPLLCP